MEELDVCEYSHAVYYYKKGTKIVHRENGPAVEWWSGGKAYWINGKKHRLDGPAVIRFNNEVEWWIEGERLSLEKEKLLNIWYENKLAIERKV